METWEISLFRDHSDCSCWRLILDQFMELLACVWSLEKVVYG